MSADHTAPDNTAPETAIIKAAEVVELLKAFRAANPEDWLSQLRQSRDVELGHYTAGEITDAIDDERFTGWQSFIHEREGTMPPASVYEFARLWTKSRHVSTIPAFQRAVKTKSPEKKKIKTIADPKPRSLGKDLPKQKKKSEKPPKEIEAHKVYHWTMAWMSKNGNFPPPDTLTVISNLTVEKISSYFDRGKVSGLEKFGFIKTKKIRSFQEFINATNATERSKKTQALIAEMIIANNEHYGFHRPSEKPSWPADHRKKSPVLFGIFADGKKQWFEVSADIRRQKGVFAETYFGDEYGPFISNHDFLVRVGLKSGKPDLSNDLLDETINLYKNEKGICPEKRTGKVRHGRLALFDETYMAIEGAFNQKIRGLQDTSYDTFHDYLLSEGYLKISLKEILDSAFKEKKKTGRTPKVTDTKPITEGALANSKRSWNDIARIITKCRHYLEDPDMPEKTLYQVFINYGVIDPKISEEIIPEIAECGRLYTQSHDGTPPPAKGGLIEEGSLKGKFKWCQLEEAARSGKFGQYTSLRKIFLGEKVIQPKNENDRRFLQEVSRTVDVA